MREQVAADAAAGRFDRWGCSTVIDEHVGAPVMGRAEFEWLHGLAGIDARWPAGNAGLIHVYGYLLSTVPTPYGLKRERWENGLLAQCLGRDPRAFLLSNAAAAGDTVLRRVGAAAGRLLEDPAAAPHGAWHFDDGYGETSTYFRTVIVQPSDHGPAALLYGVCDGARMLLVTAFPLENPTAGDIAAFRDAPPRMRYNAVLPGVAAGTGLRRLMWGRDRG